MRSKLSCLLAVAAVLILGSTAQAAVVVLNFAGLNGNAQENPLEFYNGGVGSLGSGPGPNFGISFGPDSIACSGQPGGNCNSAQIPGGAGANLLFFLTGPGAVMNVAAGFTTGFSFFYSAAFNPAVVTVWDGLNGTGTLLATINLPTTPDGSAIPGCEGTNFCPYSPIGAAFAGTALSVNFSGTANQVAFAAITLGSETPGGSVVPLPAALPLFASGLGALGLVGWRRKKKAAALAA